eukprot:6973658-Alexandrium_andersonii.AAC.1
MCIRDSAAASAPFLCRFYSWGSADRLGARAGNNPDDDRNSWRSRELLKALSTLRRWIPGAPRFWSADWGGGGVPGEGPPDGGR